MIYSYKKIDHVLDLEMVLEILSDIAIRNIEENEQKILDKSLIDKINCTHNGHTKKENIKDQDS